MTLKQCFLDRLRTKYAGYKYIYMCVCVCVCVCVSCVYTKFHIHRYKELNIITQYLYFCLN